MKKFIAILLVALLVAPVAFAASTATPTVVSKMCYEDSQGTSYCRVLGTLAFDSAYGSNVTTGRIGASFTPNQIGLASIKRMAIEASNVSNVGASGGYIVWHYAPTATAGNGVTGAIRAMVAQSGSNLTVAPLVSAASYDFSALTAVPFEAVGPVL